MSHAKRRHQRWCLERLDATRTELLWLLERRQLQVWMRETLRDMHKSPYLRAGQWEQMLATYRECFPGDRAP